MAHYTLMKKLDQTIVKNVSNNIVNEFTTLYFELNETYTTKEIYSISVENVLNSIEDFDKNTLITYSNYEKSIARKSKRLVREFIKTL